jgi:small subunit ribosomal protein S18
VPQRPQRPSRRKANPLHARGITEVDRKDTALLRTFVSDRGKIRARNATELARSPSTQQLRSGLTPQQQRRVAVAIRNAREMALLPYPRAGRG